MLTNVDAPILEFDPTPTAVIEPSEVLKPKDIPPHAVLCFFQDVIEKTVREFPSRTIGKLVSEVGPNPIFELDYGGRRLALVHPGVGAPLAAAFLEELIARGCRAFVACGGAGVLVPELALGHVIVPTAAVRDEGTSYHYLPATRTVEPTERALASVLATVRRRDVPHLAAPTWTTDGLYRETRERMRRRVAEGCISVEMEAAAFFAVARFRGVEFAQLLYGGDDLSGESWDPRGWIGHASGRELLFRLAAEAVLEIPIVAADRRAIDDR